MSEIDYQALREAAANAKIAGEEPVMPFDQRITAMNDFLKHCNPDTVLAILDEIKNMQDNAIDDGCRIAELEEALRDKQALIPGECDTITQQFESLAKSE